MPVRGKAEAMPSQKAGTAEHDSSTAQMLIAADGMANLSLQHDHR